MDSNLIMVAVVCLGLFSGCASSPPKQYVLNPPPSAAFAPDAPTGEIEAMRLAKEKLWTGWVLVQATLDSREPRKIVLVDEFPDGDVLAKFVKPETGADVFAWEVPGEFTSLFFKKLWLQELSKSPPLLMATVSTMIEKKFDCEIITAPTSALADTTGEFRFLTIHGDLWYVYKINVESLRLVGATKPCMDMAAELHARAQKPPPF
jgi:hypothetical protein